MDKKLLVVGIGGGIFLIAQFLYLGYWQESRQNELFDMFSQGYDRGVEDSVSSLFNQTENCSKVPIFMHNQSKCLFSYHIINYV